MLRVVCGRAWSGARARPHPRGTRGLFHPPASIVDGTVDTASPEFKENAVHMQGLVDNLKSLVKKVKQGGDEAARAKHVAKGKLLPRQRIDTLVDPG